MNNKSNTCKTLTWLRITLRLRITPSLRLTLRLRIPLKVMEPRRPYYTADFFVNFFVQNCRFRSSCTISSIMVAYETRLTENGIPPEPKLLSASVLCFRIKLTATPSFLHYQYQYITKKYALLRFGPVKLSLYFGHSAAPNPFNYVAPLVLYGTRSFERA